MSELASVSSSSDGLLQRLGARLLRYIPSSTLRGTDLSPEPTAEQGRVPGGRGQAPRGGVHVDDARGHAPTWGQTRKRRRSPLRKMAPLGLKAVVGESECHPGLNSCVPWGVGDRGRMDSGTPAAGSWGPGWASRPDPRGGG